MEGWIVIPNWRRFQHYRDRNPKWVKVYTELMSDPAFRGLTLHQRGLLISLWLEYATARRQLRDSTLTLTRQLGQRVMRRDVDALVDAGFVEVSASSPLAEPEQNARPELSTSYLTKKAASSRAHAPAAASAQQQLMVAARRYVHDWKGGTSDAFDTGLDEPEKLYGARLQAGDRYRLWDQALEHVH